MMQKEMVNVFVAVAIIYCLVAHPKTYAFVHKLSKKLSGPSVITTNGVSTPIGLLAHALVAALLVTFVLNHSI